MAISEFVRTRARRVAGAVGWPTNDRWEPDPESRQSAVDNVYWLGGSILSTIAAVILAVNGLDRPSFFLYAAVAIVGGIYSYGVWKRRGMRPKRRRQEVE